MKDLKYKRILLKISGKAFSGESGIGIDFSQVERVAREVVDIKRLGVELGLILGGGNIVRGRNISELKKVGINIEQMTLHNMGMLGSVLNGLSLLGVLKSLGIEAALLSRIGVEKIVTSYNRELALNLLEEGKLVLIVGGTSLAFFTHDTALAQLSLELNCAPLLKGTDVDGVYDKDPKKDITANKFDEITYEEFLRMNLEVMDAAAVALCRSYNLPIIIFDMTEKEAVKKILLGEKVGTIIRSLEL